ncbi:hypothetical protein CDL15_Pgr014959 [Punica granatum]|uniref:Uncharacterized protein n=1 Tax=Punica granatum TaxID=22663 RepID=A0A218X0H3_PUNGR|nr:hypothetical protein CDL15_Pgr014959 [Punica granatum]
MGWGDGDGHHHALQSLDWDSIMKDLDLHDDVSAPAPLNPPESTHFVNNSSDVATLSDIYSSCHQSFAHVPTSNYGSFELGGEVCNNWGFAFDFLEELIQVADCVDSGEQGSRKATTSFLAIWGSLTELGPAQPPREISVTVGTRKKMARLKHLTE